MLHDMGYSDYKSQDPWEKSLSCLASFQFDGFFDEHFYQNAPWLVWTLSLSACHDGIGANHGDWSRTLECLSGWHWYLWERPYKGQSAWIEKALRGRNPNFCAKNKGLTKGQSLSIENTLTARTPIICAKNKGLYYYCHTWNPWNWRSNAYFLQEKGEKWWHKRYLTVFSLDFFVTVIAAYLTKNYSGSGSIFWRFSNDISDFARKWKAFFSFPFSLAFDKVKMVVWIIKSPLSVNSTISIDVCNLWSVEVAFTFQIINNLGPDQSSSCNFFDVLLECLIGIEVEKFFRAVDLIHSEK